MIEALILALSAATASPCTALTGDPAQQEANEKRRDETFIAIDASEEPIVIVHQDSNLTGPKTVRLAGADLLYIDGDRAVVEVEGPIASACDARRVELGPNDSVGPDYQVVFVDEEGLLLLDHDGKLAWWGLNPDESAEKPEFELVWRSPFTVEIATKAKKKKKRRRRKRRRRKRRR